VDVDDPLAPATGAFVQLYHLLWELTHVCFEHPGLLGAEACAGEVCVTCSDEGRPGEVVSVTSQSSARVRTATGVVDCDTTLVAPVRPGDLVLVHAGLAIAVDGR
jgi:cation transport ATPase